MRFPPHAQSGTWIAAIGVHNFHPDWGTSEDQSQTATYYGIPYNVVDGTVATTVWPLVSFDATDPRAGNGSSAPDESDCAMVDGGGGFDIWRGAAIGIVDQHIDPP